MELALDHRNLAYHSRYRRRQHGRQQAIALHAAVDLAHGGDHERGFAAGVVNCITGPDALGAAMSTHPGIAKIAFTGSVRTGKKVMASAAETLETANTGAWR